MAKKKEVKIKKKRNRVSKATAKLVPRVGARNALRIAEARIKEEKPERADISTRFQAGTMWKVNTKNGRKALFETPDQLEMAANEYFKACNDNPWYKEEIIENFEGQISTKKTPMAIPYSIMGFCHFNGVTAHWWQDFKKSVTVKSNPHFTIVIKAIEETILNFKVTGATIGVFNPTIVSREMGEGDAKTSGRDITPPNINVFNSGPPLAGSEDDVEL